MIERSTIVGLPVDAPEMKRVVFQWSFCVKNISKNLLQLIGDFEGSITFYEKCFEVLENVKSFQGISMKKLVHRVDIER